MALLRNLSVAWKLGLGAATALLMLATLVGLVRWNLYAAEEAQQAATRADRKSVV